jgi:hypothetical protein
MLEVTRDDAGEYTLYTKEQNNLNTVLSGDSREVKKKQTTFTMTISPSIGTKVPSLKLAHDNYHSLRNLR